MNLKSPKNGINNEINNRKLIGDLEKYPPAKSPSTAVLIAK